MQKEVSKFTFRGMNQDINPGKHPLEFYYNAKNIRFTTTDKAILGAFSFEKGNELQITLPDINIVTGTSKINLSNGEVISYVRGGEIDVQLASGLLPPTSDSQNIIGHSTSRDSIILFSTDSNGMDVVWEVLIKDFSVKLLYLRNLEFSIHNPIQCLYNYENKRIEKVYWVDGKNQLRSMNIRHSKLNKNLQNLIDVDSTILSVVSKVKISQPIISDVISGGTHTAGRVQYGYNLYRLNASQSKLSPLSSLVSLTRGSNQGGGKVNEIVGTTPIVKISGIDKSYTHIKVYAIKYTSYNQIPSVAIIKEEEITGRDEITVFDDGNIISEVSLEELIFLGGNPIIPKHIESKDNILFSSNYQEKFFDVNIDTRAYAFNHGKIAKVTDKVEIKKKPVLNLITGQPTGLTSTIIEVQEEQVKPTDDYRLSPKHNAINFDYDVYKYQANGTTYGGEGKYLKYQIGPAEVLYNFTPNVLYLPIAGIVNASEIVNPEGNQFFKDQEVYRIGLEFYNRLGQVSFPKWIADFRAPEGNMAERYNTLSIELKPDFFVWLNDASNFESPDDVPVGYRVIRADRTLNDRTIITQGVLNGMITNFRTENGGGKFEGYKELADKGNKLPSMIRVFGEHSKQMRAMEHYKELGENGRNPNRDEMITSTAKDGMKANAYQYNTIMQLFTPEVTFDNVSVYEGLELRIKGANKNNKNQFWGKELKIDTKEVIREGKITDGLTPHDENLDAADVQNIIGKARDLCDAGIFGPSTQDSDNEPIENMDFLQFYRDFTAGYIPSPRKVQHGIYGKPELTEKGQGRTIYNNDANFSYYNTLEPIITDNVSYDPDGGDLFGTREKRNAPGLNSVNSWGARCLTLVTNGKQTLEQLYKNTGITETNCILTAELVKDKFHVYAGNIYGGNTFEARKRSNYIQIGDYVALSKTDTTSKIYIESPGDTFIHKFRFSKISKTDTEVLSGTSMQITEIVESIVESTIDLRNRSDLSLSPWDSTFQPRETEYHDYNKVYSQQPTLIKSNDVDFTFVKIKDYDTRIIASKIKIPGENIDSWTDVKINETEDLNGKFGPITALCSFRDQIYAFQQNALAAIAINPRVQVPGNDGVSIELGTGRILHDHNYVSTISGSRNKWGVIVTNNAIYYLDSNNKSLQRFTGQALEGLSGSKNMHSFFVNNINLDDIDDDNPYLGRGISMGYDVLNNDVYLTYNNLWTICFNEKLDYFTGFYSLDSPLFIYAKDRMLTLNSLNQKELWECQKGKYNSFYGVDQESEFEFITNPNPDHECTFNNLEYKSVAKDENGVEKRYTWDQVRIYNDFQDSGWRDLNQKNIRKLNRKYRIALPRNQNSTDRIKDNWAHIQLIGKNPDKLFYVNHDMILHYIINHIMIR